MFNILTFALCYLYMYGAASTMLLLVILFKFTNNDGLSMMINQTIIVVPEGVLTVLNGALHSSRNEMTIPFQTEWNNLIPCQPDWNELSIPTGLGIPIRPDWSATLLMKYAPGNVTSSSPRKLKLGMQANFTNIR